MDFKRWVLREEVIFQTAKGSVYRFDGQRTVRFKTPHQLHDAGDVGLKNQSETTVFVSPETANEIGWWGSLSPSKKRVVLANDEIYLLSWNTAQNRHGMDKIHGSNKYTLEPRLGLAPVELWDRDTFQWAWVKPGVMVFKGWHPGNQITKIGGIDFPT